MSRRGTDRLTRTWLVTGTVAVLALTMMLQACDRDFPAQPTPFANTPLTTLSGTTYSGVVMVGGTTTSFNMTLIARALGLAAHRTALAQIPNTVEVTGSFETGGGLRGTVDGALVSGTLQLGQFQGHLNAVQSPSGPACTRSFSGPVTVAGVWWQSDTPVPGCLLPDRVEVARTNSPPCQYALSASPTTFGNGGGSGILSVSTASGCAWQAESLTPAMITVTDTTRKIGAGSVSFIVSQHTSTFMNRQGDIRVANQTVTITQRFSP